jgi:hypothetical protein
MCQRGAIGAWMRLCAGCRNNHFLLKECLAALTGECRIRSRRTTAAFRQSNRKDRFCQKKRSPEITTHSDFTQHSFLYMLYFKKRKINLFLIRISIKKGVAKAVFYFRYTSNQNHFINLFID